MEYGEENIPPRDDWWIDYSRWPGPRYTSEKVKGPDYTQSTFVVGHHRYKAGELLIVDGKPLGIVAAYRQTGGLLTIAGEDSGVPVTSVTYKKHIYYY